MPKKAQEKKGPGQPTIYTKEIVDELCDAICTSSRGLPHICKANPHFPKVSTIMRWLGEKDKQYFREQYARAKEIQADFIVDEAFDIADDGSDDLLREKAVKNADGSIMTLKEENREFTNRSKLRVDIRKWKAARLAPKKYGDAIESDRDDDVKKDRVIIFKHEDFSKLSPKNEE